MGVLKLYLDPAEKRRFWHSVEAVAGRIGAEFTSDPTGAALMPLTDVTAKRFAASYPEQYMSSDSFLRLTDRVHSQALPIPVVFTTLNPDVIKGPVFVKQRRTYKQFNPMAYTAWGSVSEFLQKHGDEFRAFQKNPDDIGGELVFQPLWNYPAKDFETNFSVNQDGEICFSFCGFRESSGIQKVSRSFVAKVPEQIEQNIRKVCSVEKIRGGFHCVEWSFQDGQWKLFDWNPRPSYLITERHFMDAGLTDAAVAHMCGIEISPQRDVFLEQRGYHSTPIPTRLLTTVEGMGLYPRLRGQWITLVSGVADSPEKLEELFTQMEKKCVP